MRDQVLGLLFHQLLGAEHGRMLLAQQGYHRLAAIFPAPARLGIHRGAHIEGHHPQRRGGLGQGVPGRQ
ncbi:hypothetical protein D3C72_2012750 [compost metagenome]